MKLEFTPNAYNTFQTVKSTDPEKAERIKVIIKDAMLHPDSGVGEPILLDGKLKGIWQRKISFNEFIYYIFDEQTLTIAAIKADLLDKVKETAPEFKI